MHPEITETSDPVLSSQNTSVASSPFSQHGIQNDLSTTPPPPQFEERAGGSLDTGSEWSLSTESIASDEEARLNAVEPFLSRRALYDDEDDPHLSAPTEADTVKRLDKISKSLIQNTRRRSAIQGCSQEILLQILSLLPATDLLNAKLVSRRFYDLANSPYAWISAFSRYFPGSNTIRATIPTGQSSVLLAERRPFTRLSPVASWTSEYLLRTKLLRCLERGRPSFPFAAPSQGKPHKGFATFSFHSRLRIVTHLDAKFGPVHDKRLPQFIHGSSTNGHVTVSDRRGEYSGWALNHNAVHFRNFEDIHPGTAMWGAGSGEVVGLPNVMDLNSSHGMIYGEGLPGGYAYFISNNEKYGRILAPFAGAGTFEIRVPRVLNHQATVCSVWVSPSIAVSRQTSALVGMLTGSSCGVVSAYSLGVMDQGERLAKGELTGRWILSPGVPIVSIKVDQNLSLERVESRRVWAVALNALGEVFYLQNIPKRTKLVDSSGMEPEILQEMRAWSTGRSAPWYIIPSTQRHHRPAYDDATHPPVYLPKSVWPPDSQSEDISQSEYNSNQLWLAKSPHEIQTNFTGWDMRQRLEVDFAADDGDAAGEAILVFRCGYSENIDGSPREPSATRYVRHLKSDKEAEHDEQSEWRSSHLNFGLTKPFKITATAIDSSKFAMTTIAEDVALWQDRLAEQQSDKRGKDSDWLRHLPAPKVPGQRARLVAAGTNTGQIYLWNIRAAHSTFANVTNDIHPLRVVNTQSLSISALALTALYLVHGGSEGLVQAWDPLGSTTEPVRTICSALNRRALLAAQQGSNHPIRAVGAICLDPDPTLLRGIVALRESLRYFSYSSSSSSKDPTRSQKRRMQRSSRGAKSSPSEGYTGTRRVDLKGFVSQEMGARYMEEQEKRAEEKKNKRINGRFGVDLLGEDASEEELIAYAKLLSEEEQEKQMQKAMEKRLDRYASEEEVRAHVNGLSLEDFEKWRYASWDERFAMPASNSGSATRQTASPLSTPLQPDPEGDANLVRAMQLSLDEQANSASASHPSNAQHLTSDDDAVAEAIRRSLNAEDEHVSTPSPKQSQNADDDIAMAIRLSLQDQENASGAEHLPRENFSRSGSIDDESEFPPLGSSPMNSPPMGTWGKGKRRA